VADINNLLLQVAKLVTSSRDDPRRQSLLKMIACVLNKQNEDSNISPFVDQVVFDLWTSESDHDRRKETLELQSWVRSYLNVGIDGRLQRHWCYGQIRGDMSWCNFSLTCYPTRNGDWMPRERSKLSRVRMICSINRIMR